MTKQALITGGTKGIGRAVADVLARAGYDLTLTYGADTVAAEEAAEAIRTASAVRVDLLQADITDPASIARVASHFEASDATLDAVVLNAGTTYRASFEELELAVRAMKMRGFVVATKAQATSSKPDLPVHMPNRMIEAQVKKIRALWLELHRLGAVRSPSELSLARFVKRMTGIDYHGWLGTDDAIRVIEHLKKWKVRVENGGRKSA